MAFLLYFFFLLRAFAINVELEEVGEGREMYAAFEKKAKLYGGCWTDSLLDLKVGCKNLNEEIQSRLALSFANCFLKHATQAEPCNCLPQEFISVCINKCSDRLFTTYRAYYIHTQNVCHFLRHQEWQADMAKTAMLLTDNSRKISMILGKSSDVQHKMLNLQLEALAEQKKALLKGRILKTELMESRKNAKQLYNDFKSSTLEQQMILVEIFSKIKDLQNFVLSMFSGVYTVVYFAILGTSVYISTSVTSTAGARIWLIGLIILNAIAEYYISLFTIEYNTEIDLTAKSVRKNFAISIY